MKVYRRYLAKPILAFYLVLLVALPLAIAVGLTCAALGLFGTDGPPTLVFLVVLPVALFGSYMWLRIPSQIQVENNTAEFHSVLRKRNFAGSD
jgi:hypothetical protein